MSSVASVVFLECCILFLKFRIQFIQNNMEYRNVFRDFGRKARQPMFMQYKIRPEGCGL
jgi:hypothetical protein